MATLASLNIALTADSAKLKRDLDKAGNQSKKFSQRVGRHQKGMAKGFKALQAGVVALGAVMGAGKLLQNADELKKNADAAGINFEAYQRLKFGYEQAGISSTGFAKSTVKLNTAIKAAGEGSKTAVEELAKIGFTYEDLMKMNPEDRFNAVAKGIENMADAGERQAFATKIMGKEFATADFSVDEVVAAGESINVISTEAAEGAEGINDSFNKIQANFTALSTNALSAILPTLIKVTDAISSFSEDNPTMTAAILGIAAIGIAVTLVGAPFVAIAAAVLAVVVAFENMDAIIEKLKKTWDSMSSAMYNAVFGDGSGSAGAFDPNDPSTWKSNKGAGFATGGFVSGAGTGTSDSIPAMLSNGEYVINAASTSKFLPILEALNNGTLPAFRNGGSVGNGSRGGSVCVVDGKSGGGNKPSIGGGDDSYFTDIATDFSDTLKSSLTTAFKTGDFSAIGDMVLGKITDSIISKSIGQAVDFGMSFLGFSDGGMVPSTPNSKSYADSVPAMLTPGELVVPKSQVDNFLSGGGSGGGQTFNINVTGDVSRLTRKEIAKMMPEIAAGTNMLNKENNIK